MLYIGDHNYNISHTGLDGIVSHLTIRDPGSVGYQHPGTIDLMPEIYSDPNSCSTFFVRFDADANARYIFPNCHNWNNIFWGTLTKNPGLGDGVFVGLPNEDPGFWEFAFNSYPLSYSSSNRATNATFWKPKAPGEGYELGRNPKDNTLGFVDRTSAGAGNLTLVQIGDL